MLLLIILLPLFGFLTSILFGRFFIFLSFLFAFYIFCNLIFFENSFSFITYCGGENEIAVVTELVGISFFTLGCAALVFGWGVVSFIAQKKFFPKKGDEPFSPKTDQIGSTPQFEEYKVDTLEPPVPVAGPVDTSSLSPLDPLKDLPEPQSFGDFCYWIWSYFATGVFLDYRMYLWYWVELTDFPYMALCFFLLTCQSASIYLFYKLLVVYKWLPMWLLFATVKKNHK